jgi:hypothetical protein
LGNSGNGLLVDAGAGVAEGTLIGGTNAGEGNLIAFNSGRGVVIATGLANAVFGNAVYSNSLRGISLGYGAVPPNDAGDGDTGPNDLQNFPVLLSVAQYPAETRISGNLQSKPVTTYRIEFFDNGACDSSGYGQGGA